MELGIQGRTALVTGASIGIGRGIATALAREGVRLAVVARRRNLLEELQKELKTELVIIEQDFMRPDAPERIAKAALEGLGSVEILVNNAGGSRRFTLEANEEQWDEALTLNFTRQRQLTHRLLPQMIARKWGRIINITGKSEPEGLNGAFAAKAAMHSWAKGLSREETREAPWSNRFSELDKDNDGRISQSEFNALEGATGATGRDATSPSTTGGAGGSVGPGGSPIKPEKKQ